MGFDLEGLRGAVARHGRVARVVVAQLRGSSPREAGAAMLVWADGQSGTIGGGALEFEAARTARGMLEDGGARLSRHALGPDLGQCCGGSVALWTEVHDAASLAGLGDGAVIARGPGEMPLPVARLLARVRAQGDAPVPGLVAGWMVEPVHRPAWPLWIWGAGHVGRALVDVLAPLDDLSVTWVDTAPERFPGTIPGRVRAMPVTRPCALVGHAPRDAAHLVLTYSHVLDLELCHRLLGHGFASVGLIGSATKWARFRRRLVAMGHAPARVDTIACPIGDPGLGKQPQAIAIGVAASLLREMRAGTARKELSA